MNFKKKSKGENGKEPSLDLVSRGGGGGGVIILMTQIDLSSVLG